jgi:hypothetical protein
MGDPAEGDMRRRAFRLAWARGFPRVEVGQTVFAAGEEAWTGACQRWAVSWLAGALRALEALHGG